MKAQKKAIGQSVLRKSLYGWATNPHLLYYSELVTFESLQANAVIYIVIYELCHATLSKQSVAWKQSVQAVLLHESIIQIIAVSGLDTYTSKVHLFVYFVLPTSLWTVLQLRW